MSNRSRVRIRARARLRARARKPLLPNSHKNKLFNLAPGTVLCIVGQPWLNVCIYKPERLRCPLCQQIFTAKLPPELYTGVRQTCDKLANSIERIPANLGHAIPTIWTLGNLKRKGVFTTGILGKVDDKQVALFFTGRQHAGKNLNDLLDMREEGLLVPIQTCDALSRNSPKDHSTQKGLCNAHARRNFYEIASRWPKECVNIVSSFDLVSHLTHSALKTI